MQCLQVLAYALVGLTFFFAPQVKLKRIRVTIQQAVQEKMNNVEKFKLPANISGQNHKEVWAQDKELIKQLEEEISQLQKKSTELEQLSQNEDNLHFLQVIS